MLNILPKSTMQILYIATNASLFCADLIYSGIPTTKLGTYLENRVNNFLKKKDAGAGEVTIKVLSCTDKLVEVKPGMKKR